MSSLERLAPDQRAVLLLVLRRHRSYAEIAGTLRLAEATVRQRAHAAVVALADVDGTAPTPADADLLLGQLARADAARARAELEAAPERATAVQAARRALAAFGPVPDDLAGAAPEELSSPAAGAAPVAQPSNRFAGAAPVAQPSSPAAGAAPVTQPSSRFAGEARAAFPPGPAVGGGAPVSATAVASAAARPPRTRPSGSRDVAPPAWLRNPRRLAPVGLAALVVAALVLFVVSQSRDDAETAARAAVGATPTATPSPRPATPPAAPPAVDAVRTAPRLREEIRLRAGTAGARRAGLLSLFADGEGNLTYIVAGDELRPTERGETYALWLARGTTRPVRLATAGRVGAAGRLHASGPRSPRGGRLLRAIADYDAVIVSREPSPRTTRPNTVVLRGRLPRGD